MAQAQLDTLSFRLNPSDISYSYQIDYTTIDTLGGQVIQILGATTGDITIRGEFGQDHKNKRESWQLAESFHSSIRNLMDKQLLPNQKNPASPVHQPLRFTFFDGVHNWDMKVLIKGISDLGGNGSIEHSSGKFAYGYTLTLFLVEDSSLLLKKIAVDKAISRMAAGVGWKLSKAGFNGQTTLDEAMEFIKANSTDGTFLGYEVNHLHGVADHVPGTSQGGTKVAQ